MYVAPALDVQDCGLTEASVSAALQMVRSNTTLTVLDLRHNGLVHSDALVQLRAALSANERAHHEHQTARNDRHWQTVPRIIFEMIMNKIENKIWDAQTGFRKHEVYGLKFSPAKFYGKVFGQEQKGLLYFRRSEYPIHASVRLTPRDRNRRITTFKHINRGTSTKKEKSYVEVLEEQLQEEISHRHQLEELNLRLVDQVRQLKRQQIQLWSKGTTSSDSERSSAASELSSAGSSASSGASAVPVEQSTLAYIQHAFRDIYAFIKENQCRGFVPQSVLLDRVRQILVVTNSMRVPKPVYPVMWHAADEGACRMRASRWCIASPLRGRSERAQCTYQITQDNALADDNVPVPVPITIISTELEADVEDEIRTSGEPLATLTPKKARSTHKKLTHARVNKSTKSAHLLGERDGFRENAFTDTKPEMIEKQMGDTAQANVKCSNLAEESAAHMESNKPRLRDKLSPCSSIVSDSSDTLVSAPDPRRALFSSDDDSDSGDTPP
ncbi:hypothetical protein EVAR_4876_1 [Eumeta japonica]|uniref:Centrosomal protein of 78 kDa n=1 Tax=Eumeta variegata TaxID=151549 RepID=A0A4C1T230_EUMVA|nr:hypothetical protein EVAR_4876_1 [Eumeta japonica]